MWVPNNYHQQQRLQAGKGLMLPPLTTAGNCINLFLNELIGRPIISSNKLWRVSESYLPHPTLPTTFLRDFLHEHRASWHTVLCALSRWCMC